MASQSDYGQPLNSQSWYVASISLPSLLPSFDLSSNVYLWSIPWCLGPCSETFGRPPALALPSLPFICCPPAFYHWLYFVYSIPPLLNENTNCSCHWCIGLDLLFSEVGNHSGQWRSSCLWNCSLAEHSRRTGLLLDWRHHAGYLVSFSSSSFDNFGLPAHLQHLTDLRWLEGSKVAPSPFWRLADSIAALATDHSFPSLFYL